MELLKKIFPFAFKSTEKNEFITSLVIHIIADIAAYLVGAILGGLPIVGLLVSLGCSAVGLYATAGIVLSILVYTKVIKL